LAMCSINSVLFTKISLSIRILGEVAGKILKFNYATFRKVILNELNYE
jgi:hypothetical protein